MPRDLMFKEIKISSREKAVLVSLNWIFFFSEPTTMILCLTYISEIFFFPAFQAIVFEIIIPFSSPLIGYIMKSMSVCAVRRVNLKHGSPVTEQRRRASSS